MKLYRLRNAVFFILFVLSCNTIIAQQLRTFGNYSIFFEDTNKGIIRGVEAGIDYTDIEDDEERSGTRIAFQLSAAYITLGNKTQENYDWDNSVTETLSTKGYAINTSLGVKIYNLFLDEYLGVDGLDYFIMPKVNIARIAATENFTSRDEYNSFNTFDQQRNSKNWQCYFGIEIGYEFFLSENNSNSVVLTANFNGLNFSNAFKKMPYNNMDYSYGGNFGVGASFYFGIKKKKEKHRN